MTFRVRRSAKQAFEPFRSLLFTAAAALRVAVVTVVTLFLSATASAVILGSSDDTTVVTNQASLTSYPWRTIGSLSVGGRTGCTGALVGPRHVLTAAHCAYDDEGNWWFRDFDDPQMFNPGQRAWDDFNGGPYRVVGAYARTWSVNWDYALLIIEDDPTLASLGQMGMAWKHDLDDYEGMDVVIGGYPIWNLSCDDSPDDDGDCGGYMYRDWCDVDVAANGHVLYGCDAHGGHSGAPVFTWDGEAAVIWGVHKRGNENLSGAVQTSSPPTSNLGPRVRRDLYDDVCEWIGNHPSQYRSHPCDHQESRGGGGIKEFRYAQRREDLDRDGFVGIKDFATKFRPCFGARVGERPECRTADLDRNGVVSIRDFSLFRPAIKGSFQAPLPANLVIEPYYDNPNSLPEGFPTHSYCVRNPSGGAPETVRFLARNTGARATGIFQYRTTFSWSGEESAHVLPSLAAGEEVVVDVPLPGTCYSPGAVCPFSIELDEQDEVLESNEDDNAAASFCVGPAG